MSIFSGKCDLYDSAVMIGGYDIDKIELFLAKSDRSYPLKLTEPRDLIPYYPYVPFMSHGERGRVKYWISESFIDLEEHEMLECDLKNLIREYKKAKRKGTEFKPDERWYNKDVIQRVREKGEKATIDGIHKPLHNHYRKALAEEMERNGYSDGDIIKWVYPENWVSKVMSGWDWRKDEY